jgi:hypothetical protein
MINGKLYVLVILMLMFLGNKASAQKFGVEGIDFILGYQRQPHQVNTLELGIAHGSRGREWGAFFYRNYHLTGELLFKNNQVDVVGIKGGYTISAFLLNGTAQVVYYTNGNTSDIAIRPEVGLTLMGAFDITYGYQVFLQSQSLNIGNHVLSVRLTLGQTTFNSFNP